MDGGHNYPAQEEQTIPGMDGGEMTLVPQEKVAEIGTASNTEEARPIVQEAAWHNNIDLPFISLVSKFEQSWLTNDDWNIDKAEPHWSVKWPTFWLPRQGQLTAKE
jgi:peptide/nickel transport system substrate-binding protein